MNNITVEQVEDAIDSYLDHVAAFDGDVPESYEDLLTFVSDKLNVSEDELEAEYQDMLSAAINYDEDSYIGACDMQRMNDAEFKAELQDSFMKYYNAKMVNEEVCEDLYATLMSDTKLNKLRKTPAYIAKDVPGKYQMLWNYAIREYGRSCKDEDTLGDTLEEIANKDENTI